MPNEIGPRLEQRIIAFSFEAPRLRFVLRSRASTARSTPRSPTMRSGFRDTDRREYCFGTETTARRQRMADSGPPIALIALGLVLWLAVDATVSGLSIQT